MQTHLHNAPVAFGRAAWRTDLDHYWRWLNGAGHKPALTVFFALVCAHMFEHIAQAVQVFVLGWPRNQSLGLLGLVWPWLVQSEWLHYVDVLLTLIGLILLRPGFAGEARRWWTAALIVGIGHHFEHALLLYQSLTGQNLFGAAQPTSVLQLFVPRVELHLVYNGIVLAAMLAALECGAALRAQSMRGTVSVASTVRSGWPLVQGPAERRAAASGRGRLPRHDRR